MARLVLAVVAAAVLTGCVGSLHPLYDDADDLADPSPLLGVWENEEFFLRVAATEEMAGRLLRVEVLDRTGRGGNIARGGVFLAGIVEIDGQAYIDMQAALNATGAGTPELSPSLLATLAPTHVILKATWNDQLAALPLHPKKTADWLSDNSDAVGHVVVRAAEREGIFGQQRIIMTAPPEALRAFLAEHGDEDLWLNKTPPLQRGDPNRFEAEAQRLAKRIEAAKQRRAADADGGADEQEGEANQTD